MGGFPMFMVAPVLLTFGLAGAVTLVEKSNGLQFPEREAGHTELEVADIDLDGHLDIVSVGDHGNPFVNSDEHGIMVWINDGSDSFALYQTGEFGYGGCAVGDLDLDGVPDLAWGIHHDYAPAGQIGDKLMGAALGDGTGWGWTQWDTGLASGGEDWGMFATDLADFDLDGDLDIVSREQLADGASLQLWRQDSPTAWSHRTLTTGIPVGEGLEVGDMDGDHDLDIVLGRIWLQNSQDILTGPWPIHNYTSTWTHPHVVV
ncbi:VCBS repeat-containing protein, partial [Candidatus Fermentibacteria bacterium]|nr:VCBS repeat-containing protein [Candidatus Fermentibacteria bacterium]